MTAAPLHARADVAVAAATAAATVLPAAEPLTVAPAQPGTDHVTQTFAGAALADLDFPGGPRIAVLVAADLVEALASSPLGGLDLAAAAQPALDAAAPALGAAPAAPAPATPVPAVSQAAPTAGSVLNGAPRRGIEMLHGVDMEVTVELGRTQMSVRDLLALSPGAVLELDRAAGSPADLLVNGRLIARGEVVVIDEDFGLRVTEIVDDAAAS